MTIIRRFRQSACRGFGGSMEYLLTVAEAGQTMPPKNPPDLSQSWQRQFSP